MARLPLPCPLRSNRNSPLSVPINRFTPENRNSAQAQMSINKLYTPFYQIYRIMLQHGPVAQSCFHLSKKWKNWLSKITASNIPHKAGNRMSASIRKMKGLTAKNNCNIYSTKWAHKISPSYKNERTDGQKQLHPTYPIKQHREFLHCIVSCISWFPVLQQNPPQELMMVQCWHWRVSSSER